MHLTLSSCYTDNKASYTAPLVIVAYGCLFSSSACFFFWYKKRGEFNRDTSWWNWANPTWMFASVSILKMVLVQRWPVFETKYNIKVSDCMKSH